MPDLIEKIEAYIRVNNECPKPLIWTATAAFIIEKDRRGGETLQATKQN
ncbi:hypothetical protein [Paenarthrobacter sp. PH39-S1]|nr:hypothetical protein [Paenarthrobacter sp. PH39-S1]MDJ0356596.1 hypothetical protein [Paenarthrobacter sp. PH39-S1]